MATDKQIEAMKKVFEDLKNMSKEEFLEKLEKHKDGDIAKALEYAWNPCKKEEE